ncbi:trans-1,2-dihydrobenzene-1,2-diol dehydrogenase-like [Brevipalpus obovatus]|uniref:trans-1,2-dihydrobenzene-1,2-diol dehydrogenase-like n=1 Tax=Brevipalpus obovatus TaxID=246614 RepID=UPI003D9F5896
MSSTKWGILSAGKISHDFTVCLRSLGKKDHEVVAVAARSLEDAKNFANKHGITNAYGTYQELAQDPNVQVVYVGTLASHHLTVGKLLLENGKHVLMEKPFTLSAKGAEELINLARAKKLFLMEAIWSRFNPVFKFVMEQIAAGTIGDVYHVNAEFGLDLMEVERLVKKSHGGGVMLDLGVYTLNAISMVYNNQEPLEIKAAGHVSTEGVDEAVTVALKYPNGRVAVCSSHMRAELPNECTISGTKGIIRINKPFWCPTSVVVNGETREFPLPPIVDTCNFTNSNFLCHEAEHVRECLNQGLTESPILPLKDTLLLRRTTDHVFRQLGVFFEE